MDRHENRDRTLISRLARLSGRASGCFIPDPAARLSTGSPMPDGARLDGPASVALDVGRDVVGDALHLPASESLDLRPTQELLGRSSPTTTAIDMAFAPNKATDVVRCLSPQPS